MRNLATVLAMCLLVACTKSITASAEVKCPKIKGDAALHESQKAVVTKIADGDTFTACLMPEMSGSVRIRVLGIDCPESKENAKCKRDGKEGRMDCKTQVPLGKKATSIAQQLLLKKTVRLESPKRDGNFERDVFGRVLAYVRLENGEDFGLHMVKQAHCEDYAWKYPHPRGKEYAKAH